MLVEAETLNSYTSELKRYVFRNGRDSEFIWKGGN